jgi:hypothetical protein
MTHMDEGWNGLQELEWSARTLPTQYNTNKKKRRGLSPDTVTNFAPYASVTGDAVSVREQRNLVFHTERRA